MPREYPYRASVVAPEGMAWCIDHDEWTQGVRPSEAIFFKILLALRWILNEGADTPWKVSRQTVADGIGSETRIFIEREGERIELCHMQSARREGRTTITSAQLSGWSPYSGHPLTTGTAIVKRLFQDAVAASEFARGIRLTDTGGIVTRADSYDARTDSLEFGFISDKGAIREVDLYVCQ